jgi:hypothetical protein
MVVLGWYRFFIAIAAGAAVYFVAFQSVWLWIAVTCAVRILWALAESAWRRRRRELDFRKHIYRFKQQLGPYGIRLANKAETDARIRHSLAEVFTGNRAQLKKTVEQLEVMDALFRAGMRPDGDEYLLHDCKLKYGKRRLEENRE